MNLSHSVSRHQIDLALGGLVLAGIAVLWGPLLDLLNFAASPRPGAVPVGDYPVFWLVAREVSAGHAALLYDAQAFADLVKERLGPEFVIAHWLYPPHALVFLVPPALLPYALGWLVFLGSGLIVFLWATWASFPHTPRLLFVMLIAPPILACVISGQTGLLASGLLVGGMLLRDRRPVVVGVLIGALTFKPQLGLIIPFALIAEGRFKTIAAATITALVLIGLSFAVLGVDVWRAYLTEITGGQQQDMLEGVADMHGAVLTSLFGLARSLGMTPTGATIVQGFAALCALGATISVARSKAPAALKGISYVALSYAISPYVMIYDFPALGAVAAAYALGAAGPVNRTEQTFAWLAVLTPLLQILYLLISIPLGSVAVLTFAVVSAFHCLRSNPPACERADTQSQRSAPPRGFPAS
jgi:hypothetical protein